MKQFIGLSILFVLEIIVFGCGKPEYFELIVENQYFCEQTQYVKYCPVNIQLSWNEQDWQKVGRVEKQETKSFGSYEQHKKTYLRAIPSCGHYNCQDTTNMMISTLGLDEYYWTVTEP